MAKKKFINQLYRKNKSSRVTSKMLQEQSVNAILSDPENRTLWINGNPYGNAYIDSASNTYDNLSTSDNYNDIGTIHGEIFNDFDNNVAKGNYSHSEGKCTQTKNDGEHAEGKYNYSVEAGEVEIEELDTDAKLSRGTISTIGIGTNDENRKNAFRVDNTGEVYIVGVESTLPDGRKVTYDPCTYDGTKKTVATRSLQEVIQGLGTMQEVTYGELRALINNSRLVPGMQYRITDYGCDSKCISEDWLEKYNFAGNQFDIIVVADDEKTLNKNARACHHDFDIEIKYKAENIINSNPYINDNCETTDEFKYVSYKNYLLYKKSTFDVRQNFRQEARDIYEKIISETYVLEIKKSYFLNTDIESWKLQYDVNNTSYEWFDSTAENQKILLNVKVDDEQYQLREYIFESEIDDYKDSKNITYRYKWRLHRYQDVDNDTVYEFITTSENQITTVNQFENNNFNPYYDEILLTQLEYPLTENSGELFFGLDSQLYRFDTDAANNYPYFYEDIVLLQIEYKTGGNSIFRNFLYSGETYYKGEKVYKWYEVDFIDNPDTIIGINDLTENTFETSNCNIKINEDADGKYKTFILSKSLTPLNTNLSKNSQEYITGNKKDQDGNPIPVLNPSFIEDGYFKERIKEPTTITDKENYKAGYCDKSSINENCLFNKINIFKKNNYTGSDYNIHYNLTDEVYEYNNNGKYQYYSVWSVSDNVYSDITPQKILIGDLNNTEFKPYTSKEKVIEFINTLKEFNYPEEAVIGDEIISKLNDQNCIWYSFNMDESEKFYNYKINDKSYDYDINTLITNKIKFNYILDTSSYSAERQFLNSNYNKYYKDLTELDSLGIPITDNTFKLFSNYYNTFETNKIENINLNLYSPENNNSNINYKIYSDNISIYIYYNYTNNNYESYTNFKLINKYYKTQGVINYLCDNYNNECNYDFKNIQFKLRLLWIFSDKENKEDYPYLKIQDNYLLFSTDTTDNKNYSKLLSFNDNSINIETENDNDKDNLKYYSRYFYTYSENPNATNIVDDSLSGDVYNNSILNNIYEYPQTNVFIDCYVNNNKILNSNNIILSNSNIHDNVINNCNSENDFNIFNNFIYIGKVTGNAAGTYENIDETNVSVITGAPINYITLTKIHLQHSLIDDSYSIQISDNEEDDLLNNCSGSGGGVGNFTIDNIKLHNYNKLQIIDKLDSAILFNYEDNNIKNIGNKENTIYDIPSIKTYKNEDKDNIFEINHESIKLKSYKSNTSIESTGNTSIESNGMINCFSNDYIFLNGKTDFDNKTSEASLINTLSEGSSTSEGDFYYDDVKSDNGVISTNAENQNINVSSFPDRNKLFYLYDYPKGDKVGGYIIGVGQPLQSLKNKEYWIDNASNKFQNSLYTTFANRGAEKPTNWPDYLSFPKKQFLSYKTNKSGSNNCNDYIDEKQPYKYLSTTIYEIDIKKFTNDTVNDILDAFPSFWFIIQGWNNDKNFNINFIFDCTYYIKYDIEYSSESSGSGNMAGEFDILEGINRNPFQNNIRPTQRGKNFNILCINTLKYLKDNTTIKDTIKANIKAGLENINTKIKNILGTNYQETKERYVSNIKFSIYVKFNDIGGSTVLSKSKCSWFNIQPINTIASSYLRDSIASNYITLRTDNITEYYKCMWNISGSTIKGTQFLQTLAETFKNNEILTFNDLVANSNKSIETPDITNFFKVIQKNKYYKIDTNNQILDNENNGVYIQKYNSNTLLSLQQSVINGETENKCYFNLTFDVGEPVIIYKGPNDISEKQLYLNKIQTS